ncbi:MAG: hypothetical protein P8M80_17830 [Pirellulaceae bacterium]|nr:hypothetical protein [Pirellulaceae bacterium]
MFGRIGWIGFIWNRLEECSVLWKPSGTLGNDYVVIKIEESPAATPRFLSQTGNDEIQNGVMEVGVQMLNACPGRTICVFHRCDDPIVQKVQCETTENGFVQ